MANLNQSFDNYVAKLPRTGFDIGRVFKFTSSTGMMLPVYQHVLNPGERINFHAEMQTITQPLVRPAFCDIQQKIDLFFVPFSMLFTGFGNVFYQTNDFLSSGVSYVGVDNHDRFLPTDWFSTNRPGSLDEFNDARGTYGQPDPSILSRNFFDSMYKGEYRLLMHLGYNANGLFSAFNMEEMTDTTNDTYMSCRPSVCVPWMLAAYQCIYQNYYRDDDREKRNLLSYQLDYMLSGAKNISLGYLQYHQRRRDYFTSVHVSPIMSTLNNFASDSLDVLSKVNNYLDADVASSPNYGSGPIASSDGHRIQNLSGYYSKPTKDQDFTQYSSPNGIIYPGGNTAISTGMIRSLFAVEKLNRITGRARKNYDSQVLAHFGIKVPRDIKHELTFVGSIEGNLGISTIVSNSAAAADEAAGFDGMELGERAGLGSGKLQGRALDFTAPCHGILMAIYYSVPNQSYPLIAKTDKLNMLNTRLDFYQPEYDRLGMQPIFGYEVMNSAPYSEEPAEVHQGWKDSLMIGWQHRYEQFKRKYDVHSIAFLRPYSELREDVNIWSPWVLGRNPFDIIDTDNSAFEDRTYQAPNFQSFFSSPCDLDDIFVQKYNTGIPFTFDPSEETLDDLRKLVYHPWLLFQTDPFMHSLTVDCKLVSPMSVTGEPELD